MAFATNNDLASFLPDIFDHGVDDWTAELVRAENDIVRKIQSEWFNKRYSNQSWETAKLVEAQWTQAAIYRALSNYILPRLTQWRTEGDSFREQISFYESKFVEELADQFGAGIQYDYDGDTIIDDSEEATITQNRLYR